MSGSVRAVARCPLKVLKVPMRHKDRVQNEIVERYRLIRAIHTCYYTELSVDVGDFATEFFYLAGDIIEGKPIDESRLRFVNMERVNQYLREEHRR
jgi:hypothetical protein